MRRKIIFALMIVFAMRASVAYAHGVVGDYIFLEPLITQDPAPANEFDILGPSWVKSSEWQQLLNIVLNRESTVDR